MAAADALVPEAARPATAPAATAAGEPLTQTALAKVADDLGVGVALVWALVETISGGVGFFADRSPTLYFDLAQFGRETGGRYPDFVAAGWRRGAVGPLAVQQYQRFSQATGLDRDAAIRAARWGIGQIHGHQFQRCGFGDAASFVGAMIRSEDDQLEALSNLLRRRRLDAVLRARDWSGLGREFYGPEYRDDDFDRRLAGAVAKHEYGALPDTTVRAAQMLLRYLGHDPGPVDGTLSFWTRGAIAAFTQETTGKPSFTCDKRLVLTLREKLAG